MLREISRVRQIPGEPKRRWFSDDCLDLTVWYDDGEQLLGFQLCYDKLAEERAVTWWRGRGLRHQSVDTGEARPGHHKGSPVLMADDRLDHERLLRLFTGRAAYLEAPLARLIEERLRQARRES